MDGDHPLVSPDSGDAFRALVSDANRTGPLVDAGDSAQGLARLVLTVIELLRRLLEETAIDRVEAGNLTDAEIDALGLALERLEERMGELKAIFDLTDVELNLDLGPLGRLL